MCSAHNQLATTGNWLSPLPQACRRPFLPSLQSGVSPTAMNSYWPREHFFLMHVLLLSGRLVTREIFGNLTQLRAISRCKSGITT
jgi:hypothetical protein